MKPLRGGTPSAGAPADLCASCGKARPDAYCPACGERRLRPDEFSLRRFLADGLRQTFDLDTRVGRTVRALFVRPGALTKAFMEGRRVGYLGPVRLFLLANLLYFVIQPFTGFNGYNTPLRSHMDRQVYSDAAGIRPIVEERVRERITQRAERIAAASPEVGPDEARSRAAAIENVLYPERFDAMGAFYARALVALIIPMLVLVLWLLQLGRGVPLLKHVVFAIHLHAWELLFIGTVYLLALGGLTRLALVAVELAGGDPVAVRQASTVGMVWGLLLEHSAVPPTLAWVTLGLRRAYGLGWVGSGVRAVLLVAATLLSVFAYRYLLFWVTFASV
ncbi:MAG: DUF3667 domain-containing protein [Longimicrobiales bacterium]